MTYDAQTARRDLSIADVDHSLASSVRQNYQHHLKTPAANTAFASFWSPAYDCCVRKSLNRCCDLTNSQRWYAWSSVSFYSFVCTTSCSCSGVAEASSWLPEMRCFQSDDQCFSLDWDLRAFSYAMTVTSCLF